MRLNTSRARRRQAVRMLRSSGVLADSRLSSDARAVYVMGLLVADDSGHVSEADLRQAMLDPEARRQAALLVLAAEGGAN